MEMNLQLDNPRMAVGHFFCLSRLERHGTVTGKLRNGTATAETFVFFVVTFSFGTCRRGLFPWAFGRWCGGSRGVPGGRRARGAAAATSAIAGRSAPAAAAAGRARAPPASPAPDLEGSPPELRPIVLFCFLFQSN